MTYDDLISHFRTEAAAADARGIPRQTVHRWKKSGLVPLDQQIAFERVTDGALRADLSDETRAVLGRSVVVTEPVGG